MDAGLLGDPYDASGYALPDEERKRLAITNLLLGLGAGLGGARRGQEIGGLAQGGAQGAMMGQQAIMAATRERGMNMTQAMQAQKLKQEAAQMQRMNDWYGGGQQAPQTAGFQAPGAAANRFGPEGPPAGTAPPAPQGPTGNRTIDYFMTQASNLGIEGPVWATLMSDKGTGEGMRAAAKLIADAAKPQSVNPGQTMWSPDRGSQFIAPNIDKGQQFKDGAVSTLPGYAQSTAEIAGATTGAQEQAKAGLDLVPVPLGNGQTVMMPRAQAAQLLGGKQQSPRVEMDRPPTAQEMAWMAQNSPQPTAGLGTTQTPAQGAQDKTIAESQAKDFTDILTAERDAPNKIGKLQLTKSYLANVETGKAAPTIQSLKAYASYFAPDLAKEWTKDVPYAQAAAALANEMALQLRSPAGGAGMPGSLSNSDRDFLVSMTANASNDPRAIPIMMDAKIALEKRNQEIGKLARDYRKQNGKIDDGFYEALSAYSEAHPLFQQTQQAPAVATQGAPSRADIEAEMRRRKLLPH